MLTTDEIAFALGEEANGLSKDELYDIEGAAIDWIDEIQRGVRGNAPHPNLLVEKLLAYLERRQLARIVRHKDDESSYYAFYENRMHPKFEHLLFPDENYGDHFERLLEGTVEFLWVKDHPKNKGRLFVSNPQKHFSNWEEYPELHNYYGFAFDSRHHGSPISQSPERYSL